LGWLVSSVWLPTANAVLLNVTGEGPTTAAYKRSATCGFWAMAIGGTKREKTKRRENKNFIFTPEV
jgi:hypothetical protein